MSKISNAITMLQILSTGRKYSINDLANELEVTPRMVRIYKEELEKAKQFKKENPNGKFFWYEIKYSIRVIFVGMTTDTSCWFI